MSVLPPDDLSSNAGRRHVRLLKEAYNRLRMDGVVLHQSEVGTLYFPDEGPDAVYCLHPIRKSDAGCMRVAGAGTNHPGVGKCSIHGGNSKTEIEITAMVMSHAFARAANTTPWEALLGEVKRCHGAVLWLDMKVGTAEEDEDLVPGGKLYQFVKLREKERDRLVRASKMAIDAGIAERLVAAQTLEVDMMFRVLDAGIRRAQELGVGEHVLDAMRLAMRNELLAIDEGTTPEDDTIKMIEGQTT